MNLTRVCYLVAVCSGLRAMFNLLMSTWYDSGRVSCLDGDLVHLGDSCLVRIRVHGKKRPVNGFFSAKYGMISIELVHSGVHPLLDRMLRLMSHFGCGHLEMAYMDKNDRLEIYAVRNIAKANISRFRLGKIFSSLKLITMEEEHLVLSKILSVLSNRGMSCGMASPNECCRLAISPGLLKSKTEKVTREWLLRKYQRISRKLEFENNQA